jgi:hypothetical protein
MSYVVYRVPSKVAVLLDFPYTALIEREAPFTERSFTVSQSLR